METLLQDIRYAARSLTRRPALIAAAVLTLALGIGATTAIYSVVSAVLLRAVPFPEADRLVTLWSATGANPQGNVSYADFADLRERARSVEEMAIIRPISVNLTGTETPDRLAGAYVSASFFRLLGVGAARGRLFAEAEAAPGAAQPLAVLSGEAWRARFGAEASVVGRTLVINGSPVTVVGVLPEGFQPPYGASDIYLPIGTFRNVADRANRTMFAFARLRRGTTVDAAGRELAGIARTLAAEQPETNAGLGITLVPLREQLAGRSRPALLTLLGAVAVVLLIACFNVANLQLARAAARHDEMSVRAALGAGRGRLVRQLLTESLLLAGAGGALGVLLAYWGVRALRGSIPPTLFFFGEITLDLPVLAFAAAVTVATGVVFGLVPALSASRRALADALRSRMPATARVGRVAAGDLLVVAQVALSLVLLTSAGLLLRSLVALQRVSPGFDPSSVITMEFRLPPTKYATPESQVAFMERALDEMRRVRGVASASMVRGLPFSGNSGTTTYEVEGRPVSAAADARGALINGSMPGYFKTMRIPLRAGRDFDARDRAGAPAVAIVSEVVAAHEWPGQSPLGRRIRLQGDTAWRTIVGVAGEAKHFSTAERPQGMVYTPYAQTPGIFNTAVARTTGDAGAMGPAVRAAIWAVDRDQPVWKIRTLASLLDRALSPARFTIALVGTFAALALLLAAIGIYGVLSYAVAQRRGEVGIRLALGARATQVVGLFVRQGMRLAAVGLVAGLAAAAAVTRLLRSQLFGVGALDPLTFAAVIAGLTAVVLAACWVPATRASRVEPSLALRGE